MSQKWAAIIAVLGFAEGVHFEHNVDGSVNLLSDHMDAINAKLVADASAIANHADLQTKMDEITTQSANDAETITALNSQIEKLTASQTDLQSNFDAKVAELATANQALTEAKAIIAGRPQGDSPLLGGGGDKKTFADKVKELPHNKMADSLLNH